MWKVRGVWEKGEGDSFLGRFLMREKLKKVLCGVSVSHQVVSAGRGGVSFWDLRKDGEEGAGRRGRFSSNFGEGMEWREEGNRMRVSHQAVVGKRD